MCVCVSVCVCVPVCVCVCVCLCVCMRAREPLASDSSETVEVIIVKLGTVTATSQTKGLYMTIAGPMTLTFKLVSASQT